MALRDWPLLRQLRDGGDGTGPEAMSQRTRELRPRNEGAEVTRSVCPYCAVGCGQLIFHKDGELISIEGDPESPISRGHLCPKGAASYELLTHPHRASKCFIEHHARPPGRRWIWKRPWIWWPSECGKAGSAPSSRSKMGSL